MKTEYISFTEKMIPEAGELLAHRHRINRSVLPLLPLRFEDSKVAVKAIETLWRKKFNNGYAAFRNGKMVAYLLGEFVVQPWDRCGYVYLPGYAHDCMDEKVKTIFIKPMSRMKPAHDETT